MAGEHKGAQRRSEVLEVRSFASSNLGEGFWRYSIGNVRKSLSGWLLLLRLLSSPVDLLAEFRACFRNERRMGYGSRERCAKGELAEEEIVRLGEEGGSPRPGRTDCPYIDSETWQ